MKQGDLVTLKITDLNSSGEGVGRVDGKVVFVPDTVTGDYVQVRVAQVKSKYTRAVLKIIFTSSEYRIRPRCIVADKCGGCQWQHIDENFQREAKQKQVKDALQRIGGLEPIEIAPILFSEQTLNYRNKSTYSLKLSASGKVQAGYFRKGSHKIVNLNQCPVQDERLHPLLKNIKQDIHYQGWSIYDETNHQWQLRHLSLRIGINTGEMLLTLVSTDEQLPNLEKQAQIWLEQYPNLVGVCLNINSDRTNIIFGQTTKTIAGKAYLKEVFAGIDLEIRADTFFQINTTSAELLLQKIIEQLDLQGSEILVDAYCGIGTFTLPFAKLVQKALGVESSASSVEQAINNAHINQIENVDFLEGKVEDCLSQLAFKPDLVILDPPRKGCQPKVIETLLSIQPNKIVYVSCNPGTLARDLKVLVDSGIYQLDYLQCADFFPQTKHVETVVILTK